MRAKEAQKLTAIRMLLAAMKQPIPASLPNDDRRAALPVPALRRRGGLRCNGPGDITRRRDRRIVGAKPARAAPRGPAPRISTPPNHTPPAPQGSSPDIARSSVVFPDPLRPTRPSASPGSARSETSRSACTSVPRARPRATTMSFSVRVGCDETRKCCETRSTMMRPGSTRAQFDAGAGTGRGEPSPRTVERPAVTPSRSPPSRRARARGVARADPGRFREAHRDPG